jgi:UDP-glucuronate decarboxylase
MKTILITGGAGFIGTNLTKRLLNEGNRVIAVDNFYSSSDRNILQFKDNSNYKFIEHDIRFPLTVEENIDEIFNLACPASPPIYQRDPIFTLDTNVLGTKNMLEFARSKKAKLLHASTSEVYGNPLEHPQKESYWGNVNIIGIRSCYDEGKRISETYCYEYQRMYEADIDVKLIRIFNTYGPRMDPDDGRVVSNFIVQALKGQDITIYGDGSQTRSFQYIDDLIEGIMRTMATDKTFHGPVNLGNPDEFTIAQLATMVVEHINPSLKVIYQPLPQDDPLQRKPDISLAKSVLGWEPTISLSEGLKKTAEYFKTIVK